MSVRTSREKAKPKAKQYSEAEEDDYIGSTPYPETIPTNRSLGPLLDTDRFEESQIPEDSPVHHANETNRLKSLNRRGNIVRFFRNGDPHFKGVDVCISQKSFPNFETLLMYLNDKITTTTGVRYVFSSEGAEIKSVTDFRGGTAYIVSSVRKINREINYGFSKESFWINKKPSAGKIRKGETHLYKPSSDSRYPVEYTNPRKPRIITIISNLNRDSRAKLILNPNTVQTFEDFLSDLQIIHLPRPPLKALYTEKPPHTMVQSFSQLSRDFRDHDNFIACGQEVLPLELSKKRTAPSSDSSNESVSLQSMQRKPRKLHKPSSIYSEPMKPPPVAKSLRRNQISNSVSPARLDPLNQQKTKANGDSIRVEIHGKYREFFAPTIVDHDDDGAKPDKKLKLEWIYGYRGRDTRCNLFVLPSTGELLYYVALVAILYDKKKDVQRHYTGHNEDITCMVLHPNQRFVATGQQAGKAPENWAHIRIWDAVSLSTYAVVGLGVFQGGVNSISFSIQSMGDYMSTVDEGDKHVLSVWEWQNEKLIAKTTTSIDTVIWGCFYNNDDTTLITFGKQHIYFWKLFWDKPREKEGRLRRDRKSGVFTFNEEVPKFFTSIAFAASGDVITGDSSGSMTVWSIDETAAFVINRRFSENMKHAHKKTVFALCMLEDGTLLSGGGNEIKAWDSLNSYKQIKERMVPETAGYVRSLVPQNYGGADGSLYIGTTKSCILEGSLQHKFKFLVQGHSEDLWAVVEDPAEPSFITAGLDAMVAKWSSVSHRVIWRVQTEPCLCITTDIKGRLIVMGTTSGRFIVLNGYNGMLVTTVQVGLEQINAIAFSPDGSYLVAGTQDGALHLFSVEDDGHFYQKLEDGVLRGHKNFITHLDWSSDSRYLQSTSANYDLLFWDIENLQQIKTPRQVRDADWYTQTTTLGYNLLGPWSCLQEGDDMVSVTRSHYRDYVVTGDNKGHVAIYKYPSSTHKPKFRSVKMSSSNVTNVRFMTDDSAVVTCGGRDAALMQWAVVSALTS